MTEVSYSEYKRILGAADVEAHAIYLQRLAEWEAADRAAGKCRSCYGNGIVGYVCCRRCGGSGKVEVEDETDS